MKDAIQILREELKERNSEIGITTLEDMAKLQIEPLTRDIEKKYSIVKADYENLRNAVTTFRDIIEYHNGSMIRKEYILEQFNSFFDSFLTEVTE